MAKTTIIDNSTAFAELANPIGLFARELRDKALVLDTETTGLTDDDEVIELAVVKAVNGAVVFDALFKPSVEINPGAAKVHGFINSDLSDKPTFESQWKRIYQEIDGSVVCAWNAEFDAKLITQTCRRYSLEEPRVEWVCLMQLYQQFKQIEHRCKLEYACKAMNVRPGDHSAVNDALAAARVLYRIAESKPEFGLVTNEPLRRAEGDDDDSGYDTDDHCIITVEEYLCSHDWRERKTLKDAKIISLWTDPLTGSTCQTNEALEIQRGRQL